MNGTQLTFNGRLPGVLCETTIPDRGGNPLRLDVAGFVGFAERGPIDVPVLVEDINQFRLIFGRDLPLAVDGGLPVYAQLPGAVEAFFENGGRRCYVVRVAGSGHRANRFTLPGLLQPDSSGEWQPVEVNAAWSGRWSDFVSVGSSLRSRPLKIRDDGDAVTMRGTDLLNGEFTLPLRIASNERLGNGDLLRMHVERPSGASHIAYFQVDEATIDLAVAPSLLGTAVTAHPMSGTVRLFDNSPPDRSYRRIDQLTPDGWERLPFTRSDIRWEGPADPDSAEPYRVILPIATDFSVNVGDLLRLQVNAQRPVTFMTVENIRRERDPETPDQARLVLESAQPLLERRTLGAARWTVVQVDLLTLDLLIHEGEEIMEQWLDLRFGSGEGSWRHVLARQIDHSQVDPPAFDVDSFSGRSLRLGDSTDQIGPVTYPLGISPAARRFGAQSDSNPAGKDGLDTFEPLSLFGDDAFRTVTSRNVMTVANDLLYTGMVSRRLRGMHALLPVGEIALISLPDLAHTGWAPLLVPPFTLPEEPEPEEETPDGFHPCPAGEPDPSAEEECEALPVLYLDDSGLAAGPNIQAILENLPDSTAPAEFDEEPLIGTQRLLIRLCTAQADRMAILNLPRHYQGRLVEQWQQNLTTTPDFLDGAPLSYVACYHGWVGVRETESPSLAPLRYTTPDGAICGLMAAREIARGAWIAPANQPLRTVSNLDPEFSDRDWFDLYNLQINVFRRQPGRFAVMSALTLARDRLLTQISVRRLLIFLRKLALREGQRFVFESNNERFRSSVQTYFESVLNQLLDRGGIQAFQVVTNEEVNTPNDLDSGRFVIALKIAPTSPIEFITVVLIRSGDDGIDILEI